MSLSKDWIDQMSNPDIQNFIIENTENDISKLALKKNPFPKLNYADIINQIDARKRAKLKLPSWFKLTAIIYPIAVSLQQSSSELTANYKSTLVSGKKGVDLTGGFGIDSTFISKKFDSFIYVEQNDVLSIIFKHNLNSFLVDNVEVINANSNDWFKNNDETFDLIYVDPARRDVTQKKVFRFEDCEPNLIENLDLYLKRTKYLLVKTSPLLDISLAIEQLRYVKDIHIIAIANEVKELLFLINKSYNGNLNIQLVDLNDDKRLSFDYHPKVWSFDYSEPLQYLFVPHATLMKIGQFDALKNYGEISKLNINSHLFTSNNFIADFFGKTFKICNVIPYQKDQLKTFIFNKKLNISCRNFPLKPEELKTKWKIKDGGEDYVFFTTNHKNEKIVLFCTKL